MFIIIKINNMKKKKNVKITFIIIFSLLFSSSSIFLVAEYAVILSLFNPKIFQKYNEI